ncbi:hypothetical protein ACQKMN_08855 [Ureibacillus composti]
MSANLVAILGVLTAVSSTVSIGLTLLQHHKQKKEMDTEISQTLNKLKESVIDDIDASSKEMLKNLEKLEKAQKELMRFYGTSQFKSKVAKAADFTFNHKAYSLVKVEVKKKERGEANTFAFTSLIVKHTSKANTMAYFYLILSFLSYLILTYLGFAKEVPAIPILIAAITMIIFVRQRILVYRIKKGLYGSNEKEVREILHFVLDEKNKHYFDGKGGKTPVFDINNLEELEHTIKDYQLEGVKA